MKWPLRVYEFSYQGRVYRVGEALLLARDDAESGPGRFLYRAQNGRYFLIDTAPDPPVVTVGPGLNPYIFYGALGVKYLPRPVAIPPGSYRTGPGGTETFPLEAAEGFPLPRRGLDPKALPLPEAEPPAEEDITAVVGGFRFRVKGSRLIARGPAGKLYRTGGGNYFATAWLAGQPYVEIVSPVRARGLYEEWAPAVPREEAFSPSDWAQGEPDDGWRVPALKLYPEPTELIQKLPEYAAYGQALSPRAGRLLAWGTSRLGSGELIAEFLFETELGEFAELIWAGGADYRVLEWPPELVRFAYERLAYKVVPPGETFFEAPGVEA